MTALTRARALSALKDDIFKSDMTASCFDDDAVDEVIARHMLSPLQSEDGADGSSGLGDIFWWKKRLNSWEGHPPDVDAGRESASQKNPPDLSPIPKAAEGTGYKHLFDGSPDR